MEELYCRYGGASSFVSRALRAYRNRMSFFLARFPFLSRCFALDSPVKSDCFGQEMKRRSREVVDRAGRWLGFWFLGFSTKTQLIFNWVFHRNWVFLFIVRVRGSDLSQRYSLIIALLLQLAQASVCKLVYRTVYQIIFSSSIEHFDCLRSQ